MQEVDAFKKWSYRIFAGIFIAVVIGFFVGALITLNALLLSVFFFTLSLLLYHLNGILRTFGAFSNLDKSVPIQKVFFESLIIVCFLLGVGVLI